MPLPELIQRTAERLLADYCDEKVFPFPREEVRLRFVFEGESVLLYEDHSACPGEGEERPVARFRFSDELGQWTLHYPGPEERWHFYLNAGPTLELGKLLRHLDSDPLGVFWH